MMVIKGDALEFVQARFRAIEDEIWRQQKKALLKELAFFLNVAIVALSLFVIFVGAVG
jgi:hypothetical protein